MFSKSKFFAGSSKENQIPPKFAGAGRNPEVVISQHEIFTLLKGLHEQNKVITEQNSALKAKVDDIDQKLTKLSLANSQPVPLEEVKLN